VPRENKRWHSPEGQGESVHRLTNGANNEVKTRE